MMIRGILLLPLCALLWFEEGFGGVVLGLEVGGSTGGPGSSRSLENFLSRLNSRLDTIVLRIDHLDNRIGRIQTLLSTRLDGIENSVATMKLRLDLVKEEVTRTDENLNRKWKNFETKLETNLVAADNKYDNKLNMVLREGRRIGESLHGIFSGVEKRVTVLLSQVNTSLIQFSEWNNSSCLKEAAAAAAGSIGFPTGSPLGLSLGSSSGSSSNSNSRTTTPPGSSSGTSSNLITNKVSNMFDDLIERSSRMENMLRESVTLANVTRMEIHDSFHALSITASRRPSSLGHSASSHRGGGNVAEETSMAILETLASTESMSTTISRRLNDLTRTMEERFELVSMTLNEFYESCSRIQEGAPLIEEHIAELLEKILNSFENSTSRPALWRRLEDKLDAIQSLQCPPQPATPSGPQSGWTLESGAGLPASGQDGRSHVSLNGSRSESSSGSSNNNNNNGSTNPLPSSSNNVNNNSRSNNSDNIVSSSSSSISSSSSSSSNSNVDSSVRSSYEQIIRQSVELSEEDKKLLWDSLFPPFNGSSVPEE